jgi:hypothetical protein
LVFGGEDEGGEGVEIFPTLSTSGCGGGIDDFCPWPLGKGGVLGTLSAVTVGWDEGVAGVAADGVEREESAKHFYSNKLAVHSHTFKQ